MYHFDKTSVKICSFTKKFMFELFNWLYLLDLRGFQRFWLMWHQRFYISIIYLHRLKFYLPKIWSETYSVLILQKMIKNILNSNPHTNSCRKIFRKVIRKSNIQVRVRHHLLCDLQAILNSLSSHTSSYSLTLFYLLFVLI